jgi:uncharacterized membrane protein YphA (DoxX/SURF4 family)
MNVSMTLTRMLARPMLASMFVAGGLNAVRHADALATKAKPVTDKIVPLLARALPQAPIPSDPKTLVRVNGAVQIGSGLMLATGKAPRVAATVLAASLVPTTLAAHRFWDEDDPQTASQQRMLFFKNVSAGGGLLLAAVDTEGKPGLLWRARHTTKGAAHEAPSRRQVRREAKRELKQSRKQQRKQSRREAKRATSTSRRQARRAAKTARVELAVT